MVQNLEGMGFTVVPFGQGFKDMSPPSKELMKLTLEGKIAQGGHPVLSWMMDNILCAYRPCRKYKARQRKINRKNRWCSRYHNGSGQSDKKSK